MDHDVYICCCEQDRLYSDMICHFMEENLLKCWYPYRDMPIDGDSTRIIMSAIAESKVLLYILSESSNDTNEILSQINTAVSNRVDIITIRISQVEPSEKIQYYIAGGHWMDLVQKPLEEMPEQILEWIRDCIERKQQEIPQGKERRNIGKGILRKLSVVALALLTVILIFLLVYPKVGATNKEFQHIITNNLYIDSFFVSEDGSRYAYPYENGKVDIIETDTGQVIATFHTLFHGKINTFFCSDKDSILVMSGKNGICYSLSTGQEKHTFTIDLSTSQILISCEAGDTFFDFYYFIDNAETELVRYDYEKNSVTMMQTMDYHYICGVTKDRSYFITYDSHGELCLIDYADFSKAPVTGTKAAEICYHNLSENESNNMLSSDGEYHIKTDMQKNILVKILNQDNKIVYRSNFDNLNNVWFYPNNSILIYATGSISKINFLTNEKTDIFNKKLLKVNRVLENKLITKLLYEENSELIYVLLKKSKTDLNRLYVIDAEGNRLVQDVDLPQQPDILSISCNGDRVLFAYRNVNGVSMDMSRLSKKHGKKYLSISTREG